MRRITFAMMAGILAASLMMTACGGKKEEQTTNQTTAATTQTTTAQTTTATTEAPTESTETTTESTEATTESTEATTESTTGTTEGSGENAGTEVTVESLAEAIQQAYGDMYLPSMPVDAEIAKEMYGVDTAWHEAFFGQVPMMSAHVDMLLIFKAVPGQAENIVKALENYRDVQINDSMQYPQNMPKLEASEVRTYGDYVFYVMLGGYPEGQETEDEAKALEFAKQNNQIAFDVIEGMLK